MIRDGYLVLDACCATSTSFSHSHLETELSADARIAQVHDYYDDPRQ